MSNNTAISRSRNRAGNATLGTRIWKARYFYLFILPAFVFFLIFTYIPYFGLVIAFQDFKIFAGVFKSEFVGFKHFINFFNSQSFFTLIRNTLSISLLRLIFSFPVPIIFALLLNEVRHMTYKRIIQTITYFPNFLSWVIFAGIVVNIIRPTGIINNVFLSLGLEPPNILTSTRYFVPMLVVSGALKSFGFGAIIYLAALSGVDSQLYEAAVIDGAKRLRQIWHITLPGIRPTIVVMLIMELGSIMNAGFDQIFNLYNASVYEVADIIDTYVFRIGYLSSQYSLGTAVGLFKGVIGMLLIITANTIIRKAGEASIW
ncbi:MAG: ABC transporter permease subunit [Oscillospiraceae bacterium]|nr:ABC transporter permease subunit [Oscillospiraceae bacterium]